MDEGAPRSVGLFLEGRGHDVLYLADVIARGSPDILVATVAMQNSAILVAVDKDMRQIARRHGIGGERFKRLNLLQFRCSEVKSVSRVREAASLIEHEWRVAGARLGRRFWVEVGDSYIRTHR